MKKSGFGSKLFKRENLSFIPIILCLAFLVLVLFFNITYKRVYVVGTSMENTLYGAPGSNPSNVGGDFVYIFKAKPARGDIVVIKSDNKTIIKRVIALGGDRVKLTDGKLFLNGVEVDEPYVSPENNTPDLNNMPEIVVEKGKFFFLGDNRDISNDSRKYGCLPLDTVLGVVAEWSLNFKDSVTAFSTFFEFTLPSWFGIK